MSQNIDVSRLLSDMATFKAQAFGQRFSEESVQNKSDAAGFSGVMKSALDSVNETQKTSSSLKTAFELGDPKVSLTQVMVATQKSSLAFQATLQVRNKLVEAYREIMNMPI